MSNNHYNTNSDGRPIIYNVYPNQPIPNQFRSFTKPTQPHHNPMPNANPYLYYQPLYIQQPIQSQSIPRVQFPNYNPHQSQSHFENHQSNIYSNRKLCARHSQMESNPQLLASFNSSIQYDNTRQMNRNKSYDNFNRSERINQGQGMYSDNEENNYQQEVRQVKKDHSKININKSNTKSSLLENENLVFVKNISKFYLSNYPYETYTDYVQNPSNQKKFKSVKDILKNEKKLNEYINKTIEEKIKEYQELLSKSMGTIVKQENEINNLKKESLKSHNINELNELNKGKSTNNEPSTKREPVTEDMSSFKEHNEIDENKDKNIVIDPASFHDEKPSSSDLILGDIYNLKYKDISIDKFSSFSLEYWNAIAKSSLNNFDQYVKLMDDQDSTPTLYYHYFYKAYDGITINDGEEISCVLIENKQCQFEEYALTEMIEMKLNDAFEIINYENKHDTFYTRKYDLNDIKKLGFKDTISYIFNGFKMSDKFNEKNNTVIHDFNQNRIKSLIDNLFVLYNQIKNSPVKQDLTNPLSSYTLDSPLTKVILYNKDNFEFLTESEYEQLDQDKKDELTNTNTKYLEGLKPLLYDLINYYYSRYCQSYSKLEIELWEYDQKEMLSFNDDHLGNAEVDFDIEPGTEVEDQCEIKGVKLDYTILRNKVDDESSQYLMSVTQGKGMPYFQDATSKPDGYYKISASKEDGQKLWELISTVIWESFDPKWEDCFEFSNYVGSTQATNLEWLKSMVVEKYAEMEADEFAQLFEENGKDLFMKK